MFTPVLAAALSGATLGQLQHWRRDPVVLKPELHVGHRRYYSFRDVLALRTVARIHDHDGKSLQKIRQAIGNLRTLGNVDHLAAYVLVATTDTIVLLHEDEAIDLLKKPGHQMVAEFVDMLGEFEGRLGQVVPFKHPAHGLLVDPDVRGGFPVIEGTRVPYDQVASLIADGVNPEEIQIYYPSVTPDGALGAAAFADYVRKYETHGGIEREVG